VPELPEVQTVVNDLKEAGLVGATVTRARVFWPQTIAGLSPRTFCRRIRGERLVGLRRRAKYIVFDLRSGDSLLIHLRMSGRLHLASPGEAGSKHDQVILELGKRRELRFHDTRKFGRMYLVADPDHILGHLGPEPLDPSFTSRVFGERLRGRRRLLKPLLLDQGFLAGLGNIYADESLWEAGLHPCRVASSLSEQEVRALHRAIRKVLRQGIDNFGTTLGSGKSNFTSIARRMGRNRQQLNVYRRTDLPCPRCQGLIQRHIVGQRSTHLCPTCQKP
jgi:formamidopyrimidine-DNA glycosylase